MHTELAWFDSYANSGDDDENDHVKNEPHVHTWN
jgi:hypothetical protein